MSKRQEEESKMEDERKVPPDVAKDQAELLAVVAPTPTATTSRRQRRSAAADHTPGAVQMHGRAFGDRPVWSDSTTLASPVENVQRLSPAPEPLELLPDMVDESVWSDDQVHGRREELQEAEVQNVQPVTPPSPKPVPFQCRPRIILGWVVLISVISVGIGLRFGFNTENRGDAAVGMPTEPIKLQCQLGLKASLEEGLQPLFSEQCTCLGRIEYLLEEVRLRYDGFHDLIAAELQPNFNFTSESCDDRNLALLSMASRQDGDEEITDAPTLETYAAFVLYTVWKVPMTNWIPTDSICQWSGISCLWGVVVHLSLPHSNLQGTVPPEVGLLSSLTVLNLSENGLVGSLPTEMGDLTSLSSLNLSTNKLSGTIPTTVRHLVNLREFIMFQNSCDGGIPSEIGLLRSLTSLDFRGNMLGGRVPSEIGLLSNLVDLDLQLCQISGTVPSEISQLTSLEVLNLAVNNIRNIATEICSMASLRFLSLATNNFLQASLPSEIGNLRNLEMLVLGNTPDISVPLVGSIPEGMSLMTSLKALSLGYNELTGTIPAGLLALPELTVVDLRGNTRLTASPIKNLTASLSCLDVSGTEIANVSQCSLLQRNPMTLVTSCDPIACDCCTCASNDNDTYLDPCGNEMMDILKDFP